MWRFSLFSGVSLGVVGTHIHDSQRINPTDSGIPRLYPCTTMRLTHVALKRLNDLWMETP